MALPIYGYYMNGVYADPSIEISTGDFEVPEGFDPATLNCRERSKNGGATTEPKWD
jgi:hypothetical protein